MKALVAIIIAFSFIACASINKFSNSALDNKESAIAIMDIIENYFKPFTHSGFPIQPKYITMNDTLRWREFKQIPKDSTNEIVNKYNIKTNLQLTLQHSDDATLNKFYTEKVEFKPSNEKDFLSFKYLFSPIYKIDNNYYLIQCLFYSFEVDAEHVLILNKVNGKYSVKKDLITRAVFF